MTIYAFDDCHISCMHGAQHVFSQDMPCILLHTVGVGGELKEVATAKIIQPLTRDMHNTRMSELVMKVNVSEVLPEFRDIDPPHGTSRSRETHEAWRMQEVDDGMAEDPDSSWGCSSWGQAHWRRHLEAPAPGRSAPVEAATKSCCG